MDILFLHPGPDHCIMPLASVSLMNLLVKNGFEVEGCNVGMEESLDRGFDVAAWLKRFDYKAVAIDLHFNAHSYDAIRLARISKEVNPNAPVILGGFTATHFCREIVNDFAEVDIVVKGDAEKPLLNVVQEVCRGGNGGVDEMPNICTTVDGRVKENPLGYVATEEDLDAQDFTDLKFLNNWKKYRRTFFDGYNSETTEDRCWISAGRGCIYSCSYCGGSKMSHYRLCGRKRPVFRSPVKLAEDAANLAGSGVDVVMSSHDLQLAGTRYWKKFFKEVRRHSVDLGIYMGIWQLFEKDFLEDLAKTFDLERSWLVMSPTSGNEKVRRFNGKHYSNPDLLRRLEWMKEYGARLEVYFGLHLPRETTSSHRESIALAKKIQGFYPSKNLKLFCQPIMLDPCCPMSTFPEKFGVKPLISTFKDYHENNRRHYEKVRRGEKITTGHVRYFSHTTETIKDPSDTARMKEMWKEVYRTP